MKYIVKNCPAFWKHSEIKTLMCINGKKCAENTDCLIKRIVEVCNNVFDKREIKINRFNILNLLEIEEVNE